MLQFENISPKYRLEISNLRLTGFSVSLASLVEKFSIRKSDTAAWIGSRILIEYGS
jgi:hypothetical protein